MTDIQKKLDENIPREVISTRSGGGSKQLSYLETWYVIDRLNQILGSNGWSNEIIRLEKLPGDGRPAYMAITRITVNGDTALVIKDGVGYGSDKSDHNAHELAMKEAVSDSFKVAAKNLGRSLGLALYDKTQEFVGEATKDVAPTTPQIATVKKSTVDPRTTIKSAYNVLTAQRKATKEEFQAKYLNSKATKDLTDAEAKTALAAISTDFPELNLTA